MSLYEPFAFLRIDKRYNKYIFFFTIGYIFKNLRISKKKNVLKMIVVIDFLLYFPIIVSNKPDKQYWNEINVRIDT